MDDKSATGGYVLMAHLTHGVSDWLLVAMLKDVAGAAFTADLDVVESIHIDLSHLRVAGRVNLTAWQAEEARYISFLRGKQDPSDYISFMLLFASCTVDEFDNSTTISTEADEPEIVIFNDMVNKSKPAIGNAGQEIGLHCGGISF